jgi:hypothetical protein
MNHKENVMRGRYVKLLFFCASVNLFSQVPNDGNIYEFDNGTYTHCCPVKTSRKQNSLYFDPLNGIKESP